MHTYDTKLLYPGNLLFAKVKRSDQGQYICESQNDRRRRVVSRIVTLNVKGVYTEYLYMCIRIAYLVMLIDRFIL